MSPIPTRVSMIAIVVAAVGLAAGVAQLFRLRFARGDVYPPYSSLRADPLGSKALHDGLAAAGVTATRNFRDLARGSLPADGTCYVLGMTWSGFSGTEGKKWKAALEHVERGGRLVVSFVPSAPVSPETGGKSPQKGGDSTGKDDATVAHPEPDEQAERDENAPSGPVNEDKAAKKETPAPPKERMVFLPERLGVGDVRLPRPGPEGWLAVADPQFEAGPARLPQLLPQRTALAFEPGMEAGWRTVYRVGQRAVVLERTLGRGSVVLLADAFPLSNEAMLSARQPALLVWLQGAGVAAVFDESHLGVEENRGVATLARRYGLGHAALVLAAVALLFIWQNRSSLVPVTAAGDGRDGNAETGDELQGRDTAEGFVNLLRRTVPTRGLFAACLHEFQRSHAWRRLGPFRQREIGALPVAENATDPLSGTRRAHEIMARKP